MLQMPKSWSLLGIPEPLKYIFPNTNFLGIKARLVEYLMLILNRTTVCVAFTGWTFISRNLSRKTLKKVQNNDKTRQKLISGQNSETFWMSKIYQKPEKEMNLKETIISAAASLPSSPILDIEPAKLEQIPTSPNLSDEKFDVKKFPLRWLWYFQTLIFWTIKNHSEF